MSTRRKHNSDDGFTLTEVVVSMVLLMLLMASVLPALLTTLRAGTAAKLHLQGKNIAQERLEQMRDLRFHVDRQNGPFLDLLDIYYTHATVGGAATSITVGTNTLSGVYDSTSAAASGAPAAPFYKTTIASVSGHPGFSQVIYTQFLAPDGTVVPASRFQGTYNSQTAGVDAPPSLMLGVTIVTNWTEATRAKTYRVYSRITDGRAAAPLIQTQARAIAVEVSSTAADGSTLLLQGGFATVDGAQSSGSSVAGYATGAIASRTGSTPMTGQVSSFNLPGSAASTTGGAGPQNGPSCSWYAFGGTGTVNVGGDVTSGLPKAPANVDSSTPASVYSGFIKANGGGACGQLGYDNLAYGGVSRTDAVGVAMGGAPFVRALDVTSGSGASINGDVYASSSLLTASPQKSTAGARAKALQAVTLFPAYSFSAGKGLVSVRLVSAQVDCASATTSGGLGSATGSYQLELSWWGKGPGDTTYGWHTTTYSYSSTAGASVTVSGPAWNPGATLLESGLKLSDVVTGPAAGVPTALLSEGATTGARGFNNGILTLSTASTLSNELSPGYSAIKLRVGQLTCVADDQR